MKKLLMILILIFLGILAGYYIQLDPGYIAIYYAGTSIETSLWVGLISLLLLFLLLHITLRLVSHLSHLKTYYKRWSRSRAAAKQKQLTSQGINQYAEKEWKQAEKSLAKAADISQSPLENYLSAAKAAQNQGAYDRRDEYITMAYEQEIDSRPAIMMTQATLQIEAEQFDQALSTLQHLLQKKPLYKPALSLLYTVNKILGDWKELHSLYPILQQQKAIDTKALFEIEQDIALVEIKKARKHNNSGPLLTLWKSFSKKIKSQPTIILHYTKALIQFRDHINAQQFIEKILASHWIPALLPMYEKIQSDNPATLIATAEKWLNKHPNDKQLLFTLANMSFSHAFLPKAKQYSHQLITLEPSKAIWRLLGEIHEAQHQTTEAINCYKQAMDCSH